MYVDGKHIWKNNEIGSQFINTMKNIKKKLLEKNVEVSPQNHAQSKLKHKIKKNKLNKNKRKPHD